MLPYTFLLLAWQDCMSKSEIFNLGYLCETVWRCQIQSMRWRTACCFFQQVTKAGLCKCWQTNVPWMIIIIGNIMFIKTNVPTVTGDYSKLYYFYFHCFILDKFSSFGGGTREKNRILDGTTDFYLNNVSFFHLIFLLLFFYIRCQDRAVWGLFKINWKRPILSSRTISDCYSIAISK